MGSSGPALFRAGEGAAHDFPARLLGGVRAIAGAFTVRARFESPMVQTLRLQARHLLVDEEETEVFGAPSHSAHASPGGSGFRRRAG
ncbi:hypothetical protein ACKI1O_04655 [Streptomyces scabiei]